MVAIFAISVSNQHLYTLNLHNDKCQLHFNKAGKNNKTHLFHWTHPIGCTSGSAKGQNKEALVTPIISFITSIKASPKIYNLKNEKHVVQMNFLYPAVIIKIPNHQEGMSTAWTLPINNQQGHTSMDCGYHIYICPPPSIYFSPNSDNISYLLPSPSHSACPQMSCCTALRSFGGISVCIEKLSLAKSLQDALFCYHVQPFYQPYEKGIISFT